MKVLVVPKAGIKVNINTVLNETKSNKLMNKFLLYSIFYVIKWK